MYKRQVKEFIDYSTITNSSTALKTLCEYGGGIAVLPSYVSLLDDSLVPLSLPSAAPIQFWITYTERVRRNPAGMAALDWMLSIFNETDYPHFGSAFKHPNDIKVPDQKASWDAIPGSLPAPLSGAT